MKITTPKIAAVAGALVAAPVAALAAGELGQLVDQGIAWLIAAVVTAVVSAISGVVAKISGAYLDKKASDTLQRALENGATVSVKWLIEQMATTSIGSLIRSAALRAESYATNGAAGALTRFGMDKPGEARDHLLDMAEAKVIEKMKEIAPDVLTEALRKAGAR